MREQLERTVLTVRHAQASANLDSVWHGSSDAPLSPLSPLTPLSPPSFNLDAHLEGL